MRLADRVAIVTGAGSGIGAAAAAAMAREGARVIVADLDEAGAKATAAAIENAGGHALAITVDVTRSADNQAMVELALATWGRLDIFYANAGVPQAQGSIANLEEALIDRILAVNVKGVMLGRRDAASSSSPPPPPPSARGAVTPTPRRRVRS
jgi:3-oxoacyl-[acyl-carrier protein] reductase